MLKKIALIYFALVLCACSSSASAVKSAPTSSQTVLTYPNYWLTLPQPSKLVVIGVSGKQIDRETEIAVAREDAARKAAMYHGVQVEAETVQSIGSGFLDHYIKSQINLEYDQQLEKYMDKLVFDPERDITDSEIDGKSVVFIRFTYPAVFPGGITYSSGKKPNGSPEWISRPPASSGNFILGVGHSGKQFRLSDTILKSYESAAAALATRISTTIETTEQIDTGAYQNTSAIVRKSAGNLRCFAVIETWIDPNNLNVWTLAVAENVD